MYFNKNLNNPAMDNDKFKKQSQEILSAFSQDPPDRVWLAINASLDARKRKRRMLFWLLPLSILAGVISINHFKQTVTIPGTKLQTLEPQPGSKADQHPAIKISETAPGQEEHTQLNSIPVQQPTYNKAFAGNAVKQVVTEKKRNLRNADADALSIAKTEATSPLTETYQREEIPAKTISIAEPVWLTDITSPEPINLNPSFKKDTIIVITCVTAKTKPIKKASWQYQAAYSFHGTGDLEGAQLEWGFEKNINRYFSLYNNIGVSLHGGSVINVQPNNTSFAPTTILPVGSGSLYEISTGIQTAPTIQTKIPGTPIHIGIGGLLRYQFNSGGSGYSIRRNQNMTTFTIGPGNYTGFSLGYRVNLGLELVSTRKNKIQFQAGFQNDTRGDVITGLGLVWKHAKQ
jgi:hypothetical protein